MRSVTLLVFCTLGGYFLSGATSLADTSKSRLERTHAAHLDSDLSSRRRVRRSRSYRPVRTMDDEKVLYRTVYKCEAMASTYQFDIKVPGIQYPETVGWYQVTAYRWTTGK